jgi:O-acetyl-ADP-ribose deacetylase (regulator of RNase III)
VDAIVNAANGKLTHGGGLARAIVKKGGKVIQTESDRIMAKSPTAFLADATVVSTSAGLLPCKHVLHAVGPVWKDGRSREVEALEYVLRAFGKRYGWTECVACRATMRRTLEVAESKGLTSIACPGISSGIFGFPRGAY